MTAPTSETNTPYLPKGTYEQQRYLRLCESVFEYLSDDGTDVSTFLSDLDHALKGDKAYYDHQADRYQEVIDTITAEWVDGCL
jgi:uncharacterized protein CbrC (UPF0167 family)